MATKPMDPALRGVLLAKSDHPPKPAPYSRTGAGRQVSKTVSAAAVAAARAQLEARVAKIEAAIDARAEARQASLRKILDGILEIEEKLCEVEKARGEADRVPIRKMTGLTPAQQLAALNSRSAVRKGLNGHDRRSMWEGVF